MLVEQRDQLLGVADGLAVHLPDLDGAEAAVLGERAERVDPLGVIERAGLTPDVASRLEALMAPVSDRAVLIRLQNNIFARAQQRADWPAAERSALRRALLNPADHRPWLDVARAREGQGALVGAQEALSRATILDGGAAVSARAARERVRMQLN